MFTNLENIEKAFCQKMTIEEVLNEIDWKNFEKIISSIFEKHEFKIFNNYRFKTKRRYEIDLLAVKNGLIFLVDCKKWSMGRYKKSALKRAIIDQKSRAEEFKSIFNKEQILNQKINEPKITPILITFYEEDLIKYDDVLVVPMWKLNEFLLNNSEYI